MGTGINRTKAINLGGGTICYFSVNMRDRFPGHMVLDAFCHNEAENKLKILKINF